MFVKSGAKVRILFWLTNSRMLFLHFVPRFIGNDGKSAYLCDGIPALIIHPPIMKTAKGIWKNIGLILLCLGALNLAACFFTRHISNAVLGVSLAVIFGGLFIYIIQNKRTDCWPPPYLLMLHSTYEETLRYLWRNTPALVKKDSGTCEERLRHWRRSTTNPPHDTDFSAKKWRQAGIQKPQVKHIYAELGLS